MQNNHVNNLDMAIHTSERRNGQRIQTVQTTTKHKNAFDGRTMRLLIIISIYFADQRFGLFPSLLLKSSPRWKAKQSKWDHFNIHVHALNDSGVCVWGGGEGLRTPFQFHGYT